MKKLKPIIMHLVNLETLEVSKQVEYIMECQSNAVLVLIAKWYEDNKSINKKELLNLLLDLTTCGVKNEISRLMPSDTPYTARD